MCSAHFRASDPDNAIVLKNRDCYTIPKEMDKKMFAELMEGANQMADHAAGKKVKGIVITRRKKKKKKKPER